ncbi:MULTISPECIES: DUF932 domain-containing protein [Kitasatospora]|uniref:DUF932 domain-containing protein n=1 Tax=Kitasatospora setae (strain ATCC 33774 / DSM 43861 / JCM 3304 / KCC A-0304 / NBRC 14216 / KM-6054) TaxID=452652 RepID=E4NHK7_KITSK|nr:MULTISPECIES: DUF932 domain-containing protein [Kitasatospora]BAJ30987.1 hypothetical protein KSE_52110 [Kitasatospora setae KM-6054]
MPANVDSMFSVREMPWHREGTVLDQHPTTWEEARPLAGLDWDVITETVYELVTVDAHGQPHYAPVEGWQRFAHSKTGKTLWISRDSYELIGMAEMGEIMHVVLKQPNLLWETGGSIDGGRQVWCLVLLDEPIQLPGDSSFTLPYMALTNRFGQAGGCTLRATAVRIVCGNTFRAAELEGERTGATYSFIHKRNWREHLEDARLAVTGARQEFKDYQEWATELLGIRVTPPQRELFVREFIPMPPEGLVTDRVARNVEEARKAVRGILASPTTEPVAHTAYGLVQAAGEYLDHVRRSRSWETKLNRTLIKPEPLKAQALKLVREVVLA